MRILDTMKTALLWLAIGSLGPSLAFLPQAVPPATARSRAFAAAEAEPGNSSDRERPRHPCAGQENPGTEAAAGLETWDRRGFLAGAAAVLASSAAEGSSPARAVVTDETDNFADNYWSKSPAVQGGTAAPGTASEGAFAEAPSDEVTVGVSGADLRSAGGIGLELGEVEFRTNRRVYVKSVSPGSPADRLGIKKDWIVVSVNGASAERTDAEGVAIMIYKAAREPGRSAKDTVDLRFRNPVVFRNQLRDLSSSPPGSTVVTQVAPEGDTTQRNPDGSVRQGYGGPTDQADQRLTVTQLVPPKICRRGATEDDLLEISYVGKVAETGAIFDGSAVRINGEGIAGRGNDVSIFFVLGKQPFGQFPPGWDAGLEGICVGERRRLLVPPVLAYGSKGLPRRGIPPDATLQYDVTLVSLNGLATPQ